MSICVICNCDIFEIKYKVLNICQLCANNSNIFISKTEEKKYIV